MKGVALQLDITSSIDMAMCTSRRACSDRNSFRLYKTVDGKISDGKYIWTEYRCRTVAVEGSKTCIECAIKLPKHKYQSSPKCDHGYINGPYPSDSKLYGSPFYTKQLKDGWLIKEADELRAKEAMLTASSSMPKKQTANIDVPAEPAVAVKPKPPRKIKLAKNATEAVLTTVPPVMPSAIPSAIPSVIVPSHVASEAKFVEQMTPPIKVHDVITVKVKKIRCQGKEYYFDSMSGKAYAVLTNGVGPYKGRYDPEAETLSKDFPDSDVE